MSATGGLGESLSFSGMLRSFAGAHLLHAGFRLGLFEALREPRRASAIVRESDLAPDLLEAWLRAAEAQGFVRRMRGDDGDPEYRVAGLARWIVRSPDARSLVALLDQAVESYGRVFERLPGLARGSVRPEFGARAESRRAAEVSRLLEGRALAALSRIPGMRRARRVLDIGCGQASYLVALLRRYRDARGLGIERDPDVAELARRGIAAADLVRRAEVRACDFMTAELEPGAFDLVLLNNNLYYFAPDARPALFARVRERLAPGGIVAIQVPVASNRLPLRILGVTASLTAFDLFLRAHANLYGLPDPREVRDGLRDVGFETVGERSFAGGSATYVWARTAP